MCPFLFTLPGARAQWLDDARTTHRIAAAALTHINVCGPPSVKLGHLFDTLMHLKLNNLRLERQAEALGRELRGFRSRANHGNIAAPDR